MEYLLSENSPIDEHPKDINIILKKHQLAMIKKCKLIENTENNYYGIMNDKPATGKTYVILSLIYDSLNKTNQKKTNIIVVPQNIYSQWVLSIETFSNNLTYKKFISYENIISLYNDTNILFENDIILTTSSYYHIIATTLNSLDINVDRIFFDEIDSISNMIQVPIKANFIWFVSASFDKELLGDYKYKIEYIELKNITCKCTNEFIDSNIFLDTPLRNYYLCKNIYVDNILENILSEKEINGLNAMDYTLYNKNFENQKASNEKEIIELLLKNRKSLIEFEKCKLNDAQKKIIFYEEFKNNYDKNINDFSNNIQKLNILATLKEKILYFISNFNKLTDFYLEIRNIDDKDGENIIKESRKTELKTLHNIYENILENLYNLNDVEFTCKNYYEKKILSSSSNNLIINLKQLIIMINSIYEILFKLKSIIIESNNEIIIQENKEYIDFHAFFIDTKNYINEFINIFNTFENTIICIDQLEIYNKIINISNDIIIDNENKIKLIYQRLVDYKCCPICYEFFNEAEIINIYITPECCNNKICESCIDSWYKLGKTSCIFCNTDNIYKDNLLCYKNNENTENSENKENNIINDIKKVEKVENIQFEIKNYNKNIFLKNFIKSIKDVDKKIIIFSDYPTIFQYIENICNENEIKYIDLEKGNIKDIDNSVREYKFGNAKILLSNSSLFGCGMNFENSTDIIFVHKMNNEMQEQVIGRAQRMGRKSRLNIIYLEYENESEFISKKKNIEIFKNEHNSTKDLEEFYNQKQCENLFNNLENIEFDAENNLDFDNQNSTNIIGSYDSSLLIPDEQITSSTIELSENYNNYIDINLEQLIQNLN
jgi:hypothetical protein